MRVTRALTLGVAALLVTGSAAKAATPELSTTDRLKDRRVVAAGERATVLGFADGRFYAHGWHITGEMGGVWSTPLKLVDGVWFGIDDQWVGEARRFRAGWGHTTYDLPRTAGFRVRRTDFASDTHRAALLRLTLVNRSARRRTATVRVQAHSELMGQFPWGFAGTTPNAADNLPDHGTFTGDALQFTDDGALTADTPEHHYAALVASTRTPVGGQAAATGGTFRGPQGDTVCKADQKPDPAPSDCDDGPFGRGTGGELRYRVRVPARGSANVWVAVAGSDHGVDAARAELEGALAHPARELAAKVRARRALARRSRVSLPGDRLLQRAVEWGKQNLADLTQHATDLQIRWTNQGTQFPPPLGTVPSARWIGAGFPDYPWIFGTDAEYTAFAALALGQFDIVKDNLRTLRDISDVLNGGSGIVVHEAVPDGSVYFGHDSVRDVNGVPTRDFNTDETIKFPSIVALVWRWTGDDAFRDDLYDFAVRNLHAVDERLDVDRDGWPEGSGNVERTGMGPEKLDNAVYYVRALLDLADMARSKGDTATEDWAADLAQKVRDQFEGTWFDAKASQYADSLLDPGNVQNLQKHWIGSVPMEAELTQGTQASPGLAAFDHATAALAAREGSCYSGERPGNLGLHHTACGGGPDGKGELNIFSLTTSIQAVGEGNYGRLGAGQQRRYTDANAETMFSEPATGGTPDEMPGAMPEIFPSSPYDGPGGAPPNIDRCWTCRSMFMQAWGNYGTAWSVIHQQLGIRPFVNEDQLQVVPQVPPDQPRVGGSNIRVGSGRVGVVAARDGRRYTTKVDATRLRVGELVVGHTLPRDAIVASVRLDGRSVADPQLRMTNRGLEVTVPARPRAQHVLEVTAQ